MVGITVSRDTHPAMQVPEDIGRDRIAPHGLSLLDAIPPILARYPRVVQLGTADLERFAVQEGLVPTDFQRPAHASRGSRNAPIATPVSTEFRTLDSIM